MPVIQPRDFADCRNFIKQHESEIRQGVYDIQIRPDWVKQLDHAELFVLAQKCSNSTRIIAHHFISLPPNILDVLIKSVPDAVASNPNTPTSALNILANDSNINVRATVAQHLNTPATTLNTMSKDSESYIRKMVASNPNTPTATLNILARDSEEFIRTAVVNNPNTPTTTLNILARDSKDIVRGTVASNPNTPT